MAVIGARPTGSGVCQGRLRAFSAADLAVLPPLTGPDRPDASRPGRLR